MRIHTGVFGVIACFAVGSAFAAEPASREEHVGISSGLVVGAVVGGPVGALLGSAVGAKLGDVFGRRKEQVAALSDDLEGSRARVRELQQSVAALNGDIDSLGGDLERMRSVARPELLSLLQAGIEMDLLFKTDEYVLTESTDKRLNDLAASLAAMPDVFVKLDGYADERGDANYNQDLSIRRVEHVRDVLIINGVPEGRIQMDAHGETPSADGNVDSYALERKVSLVLFIDESPSFAANPLQ
ncbi:MAG: OmpA family protein [Gammaproteobacteria bacterium]|nr:OmpA family protein [Gammaproteobacteria bacterium]